MPSKQVQAVDLAIKQAEDGFKDFFLSLPKEEQEALIPMLVEAIGGDEKIKQHFWEIDYIEKPVTIAEFLQGKDYLYNYAGDDFWDVWLQELQTVFEEKETIEWILTGPIGGGKSFTACAAMAYILYRLGCMRSPQKFYGLAPGSKIAVALFNTSLAASKMVAYGYIRSAIIDSPWFNRLGFIETRLGIFIGHNLHVYPASNIRHALGMNLFGGILDELNFLKQSDKYNAYSVYTQTKRRMESRYQKMGKTPGLLALVSSKKDSTDWLETHIEGSRHNPTTHITDKPLWEFKPENFSKHRFRVVVGDMYKSSRIVDTVKINEKDINNSEITLGQVAEGERVIEIPIDSYESFTRDIDGSLRDLAGVSTYSTSPLIPNREFVLACETDDIQHPFSKNEVQIGIFDPNVIEDFFTPSVIFDGKKVRRHPEELRFGHIDIGITGDAYGLAVGHYAGTVENKGLDSIGRPFVLTQPVVEIDFMLRVTASSSEVDLTKMIAFILYLKQSGMAFDSVTLDGFQSRHSMQMMLKNDIYSDILSVDKAPSEPYMFFRSVMVDKRLRLYHYDRFFIEAVNLIHHIEEKKVDHPDNMVDTTGKVVKGSKDVADAVAGVVYNICKKYEKSTVTELAHLNKPFKNESKQLGEQWVRGRYNTKRKITLRGGTKI